MSSEERIVRPYKGVDRIGRAFSGCYVTMTSHYRIDPGQTARLSTDDFLTLPVALWLAKDEESLDELAKEIRLGLGECGLDPQDAELIVVMSTPRLKLAEVAVRRPLNDDFMSPHISLTAESRPAPLRTPIGGCRIDAYLALTRTLEETPLRPWRKGTWLAHAQFDVRTDVGDFGFIPLPLTDDARRGFGIPPGSIRHVVIEDPLRHHDDGGTIELYIDQEILQQLAHQPSTPAAEYFQRQLFLDAMAAVVLTAAASERLRELSWRDVEESLLGRLLARIAGSTSEQTENEHLARCENLLRMTASEPTTVTSWIEALIPDLGRTIGAQLRGER